MNLSGRLAKNAVANLVRGGSTTLVSLLLPAVLVRHMSRAEYSVWVLILQIAAYCIYLELGLQTAVGRYIAISVDNGDSEQADAIYSTALVGLCGAAALALLALLGIVFAAHWLFPEVPPSSLFPMRVALLIVGFSVAAGLPSFAWTGVFIGLQRNELIALVSGGAKLLVGIGVAVAALHGLSIVGMAIVAATINLFSYWLLYLLVKRVSRVAFRLELVSRTTARELAGYCYSLMIWSLSMLMINGLDLILVGRFQFYALAPFAIASTLVTTIQGVQLAIFNATMPHAAVLHARRDTLGLGRLVVQNTQLGVLLLLLLGMPLLLYSGPILHAWVGQQYVAQGRALLNILVVANIIRLVAAPYTVALVASGQQRLVTVSPLLEGFTNLMASVILGIKFGAIGVAYGTMFGAIVGALGHLFYNLPRTRAEIQVRTRDFIVFGIGRPPGSAASPLPTQAFACTARAQLCANNFCGRAQPALSTGAWTAGARSKPTRPTILTPETKSWGRSLVFPTSRLCGRRWVVLANQGLNVCDQEVD